MMAMIRPAAMHSAATAAPKSPKSTTVATSLTRGLAMSNESVTPSGTPADTKPMKAGTAEHEQNGATTPKPAAMTLPTPSRRPSSRARVRSTLMKLRSTLTAITMAASSSAILLVS